MKKKPGYLLLEIGIIIGLLVLMVGLAIPHLGFMAEQQVRSELDTLHQFFRLCSYRAMVGHMQQELVFNLSNNSYSCGKFQGFLSRGVKFGAQDHVLGPPSAPQTPIKSPLSFLADRVIFYPDGSMQSGALYLTDSARNYTYCLTAPVGAISYLRKYRYDNGLWKTIS